MIPYPFEEEIKPLIQCQVLPPMQISWRGHPSTGIFTPGGSLGRGHTSGLVLGPPPSLRAPGRGQNLMLEPPPSTGSQGRNILFTEDIVESAIRTTVSVANCHPSVLPPLEMVQ